MRYKEPHAASGQRRSGGKARLSRATKFKVADGVALAAGAALLLIFVVLNLTRLRTDWHHFFVAAGITIAFAFLGWLSAGVNLSGALAGAAMAFVMAARDLRMFWVLLAVFAVTYAATLMGISRKRTLRTSESAEGRSSSQVMANLGVAALLTAIAPTGWELMGLAALAEAAADTASSEIGMAFPGKTLLLTTWKPVPPGMDGGVSLSGTTAALVAAAAVAITARLLHLAAGHQVWVIVYSGVLGMLVDSLLGALLEARGYLNNDLVNLLSTGAAVALARVLLRQTAPVALILCYLSQL
jgi:uncharacterized protein (TIGR00297 family)